jgi:catechol 2,3-dioxygenase-like lactoylglutathione lyase family enzyme
MTKPSFSALVPMVPVTDVTRTIKFYEQLGFQVGNSHTPDDLTEPVWAWLYCDEANVMINLSETGVEAEHSSTALWLYCRDVTAMHQLLASRGLDVGEISRPFYNPGGEFHVHDPDGYAIFVAHSGD